MNANHPADDPLTAGRFETLCAHYGEHRLAHGGAAAPPLYQTSTFVCPDAEAFERRDLPLARMLAEHSKVRRVYHPGLESHPQHAAARRQLRGHSSLFSFTLEEQTRAATHRFLNRLRLFSIGCSWGGHESLALGGLLFDQGQGRGSWLIRLHAGLEATEDLVNDVRQALED